MNNLSAFKIGTRFKADGHDQVFRVTDVGSRVLVTIPENSDASWHAGPPYALKEIVWDEHDLQADLTIIGEAQKEEGSELLTGREPMRTAMRDAVALAALPAVIRICADDTVTPGGFCSYVARYAYEIADAMVAEGSKQ